MTEVWYRCLHRFINAVYFSRIALLHAERLPASGPVLYLGLHRNGAVDGFVYRHVLPRPVFMISTQLRKSWFARLFFNGITVNRPKDEGDRTENAAALQQCVDHLRAGQELFIFPEGSSALGPRHLPFKSGAVWLLLEYLERKGPPLHVVPVGIHYERPWAFRSKVEVVVGPPISTDLPAQASRLEALKLLKRRVQLALEEVGVNVASEQEQEQVQQLAYTATLGTSRTYFESLKALERSIPAPLLPDWIPLQREIQQRTLCQHQGVPLFPLGSLGLYAAALAPMGAIVVAAAALNWLPLAAGWWAGRKFADERNVIALWRILVGIPLFALWICLLAGLTLALGHWGWLATYLLVTALGLLFYYRAKKLAVAVWNGLCHRDLKPQMLAFRQLLLQSLPL